MNKAVTKRDLAEGGLDVLDRERVDQVQIRRAAGGVAFASALEVMEFAKLMSLSQQAVPPAFRNNPGMCLAVTFQAIEWLMSPFQVANKAYVVNDRIAFESQLIHGVIEARAPLKERLNCDYQGEGPDRQCIVAGTFIDGATRSYTTPKLKDIKVKNSPLWTSDPDQQLWYYGSRSWARKWCPDVLMGIYSREEIEDDPNIGQPELPGLRTRLIASNTNQDEGHKPGHVESELSQPEPEAETVVGADPMLPRNVKEWEVYCRVWLQEMTDCQAIHARWDKERTLRNTCGVTSDERVPIQNLMVDRCKELGEA
jgi:hypothetical protein